MENDTSALAPFTNGRREIMSTAPLVTVETTEAAAAHLAAHLADGAVKAAHEAGHLICAAMLPPELGGPIAAASVSIKGSASGYTELTSGEDTEQQFTKASRLKGRIVVLLAGMEAERALFDEPTDGSTSDYASASAAIESMMNAAIIEDAPLAMSDGLEYHARPARWVDARYEIVEREMRWARDQARATMAEHRDLVLRFAQELFIRRRMDGDDIDEVLTRLGVTPPPRKP